MEGSRFTPPPPFLPILTTFPPRPTLCSFPHRQHLLCPLSLFLSSPPPPSPSLKPLRMHGAQVLHLLCRQRRAAPLRIPGLVRRPGPAGRPRLRGRLGLRPGRSLPAGLRAHPRGALPGPDPRCPAVPLTGPARPGPVRHAQPTRAQDQQVPPPPLPHMCGRNAEKEPARRRWSRRVLAAGDAGRGVGRGRCAWRGATRWRTWRRSTPCRRRGSSSGPSTLTQSGPPAPPPPLLQLPPLPPTRRRRFPPSKGVNVVPPFLPPSLLRAAARSSGQADAARARAEAGIG